MESTEKSLVGVRFYRVSDELGLDRAKVSRIIKTYIELNRADLLSGRVIRFLGLVSVEPDVITSCRISTLAMQCKRVSDILSMPYHTCLVTVKQYMCYLKQELSEGAVVDIRSIVSMHPYYNKGEYSGVQSSVSVSIKRDLKELNGDVTCVRVHTCKLLKQLISTRKEVVS